MDWPQMTGNMCWPQLWSSAHTAFPRPHSLPHLVDLAMTQEGLYVLGYPLYVDLAPDTQANDRRMTASSLSMHAKISTRIRGRHVYLYDLFSTPLPTRRSSDRPGTAFSLAVCVITSSHITACRCPSSPLSHASDTQAQRQTDDGILLAVRATSSSHRIASFQTRLRHAGLATDG
ncbi:hypothetical protein BDV95DRAFT_216750 [Massariosphaeria phaeospora]|uniref:Uncharacterized protein n=1 Tax=Massariosphaeria phaeospora TaxID=100035 RepID=A0A7C8MEA3_9PLEO|nr:hypothetical protein BDV95DRAFT_216750 [Massariosphaeria phaeospora]